MTRSPQFAPLVGGLLFLAALASFPTIASAAGTPQAAALSARLDSLARAESRVPWEQGSIDSALARARTAARPVFLDFYADWCAPCRWMDRAVYPDPLLAESATGVAMIRVDIETSPGRALAQRYDVHQYPTLVFLAADGHEVLRWPGPLSLRDTRLNLSQMAFPSIGRHKVEAARAARPLDPEVQTGAIRWYGARGEVERARSLADSLEARLSRKGAGDTRPLLAAVRLERGRAEEMAGRTARARTAYESARAVDPDGAMAWRAWLGLSSSAEAARDPLAAAAAAREAWTRNPQPWLAARVARLELAASVPALPTPPGVEDGDAGAR